ncbi:MAG: hypothetical protein PGN16_04075 [Sphingomonas phyllosphaerae]|uniref:hypothetical protein n=1 Tax=Sphingomonas phyllosphaerae TaxID=257003 RepID=UPI002FFD23B8
MVDKLEDQADYAEAARVPFEASRDRFMRVEQCYEAIDALVQAGYITDPTPTEDARERVKVLEEVLEEAVSVLERLPYGDWPGKMYSGKVAAANGLIRRARTALGNKQTPLSLSDADAGNPQKSAPPALGNKETDRHG